MSAVLSSAALEAPAWAEESSSPLNASCLAVFDDPGEWEAFSARSRSATGDSADLWESQVVVQGMHCAACSLTLEQSLLQVRGVVSVKVSAASQRATVVWSAATTKPSEWMTRPQALGYQLFPASDAFAPANGLKASRLALWRWLVAGFCMMQVMMYAFPAYITAPGDITPDIEKLLRWASWVLTLPVILFSCRPFFANALRDMKQRSISMDLPVALGIVITFAISSAATFEPQGWWSQEVYFDSLTMFVFFLLTGRWLEHRLRNRTSGALESLMQRLPDSVERRRASGEFERVAVRRLAVGDTVRILPGEAFPADGTILAGSTFADEALLTGESRPLLRPLGSTVMAGSHNLSSTVEVRIEQIGQTTRYAQIVTLMQRASSDKPRLALLADQIAKPFLWFVLVAALAAAAYWWPSDPARAVMAAVAVLVVTCPCALSLATPTAMLTSAGWLARQGVLVRRLQGLEALAQIDTVVFDKTGTLTEARMGLREVRVREGWTSAHALGLAGALARHSLHPVSRALVDAAEGSTRDAQVTAPAVLDVKEHPGLGLEGRLAVSLVRLQLGSARFCELQDGVGQSAASSGPEAHTLQVFLADEAGWLATFDLDEVVRADAPTAVAALVAAGIDVQMLSGDRLVAVSRVAARLGITQVHADSTPQSKLAHVQALQRSGRKVLMVGDGLNDGPVLASADVSVAVGRAVPLAQAQSDFVMPGGQLMLLVQMLEQARRTMSVVRQNLGWAALYNLVCIPLALSGSLSAWLAGLGMALSSLLVMLNAARLSRNSSVPVPALPEEPLKGL